MRAHQSENGTPGQSGDETNGSITSIAVSKLAPYHPQHRLHPVSAQKEVGLETLIHALAVSGESSHENGLHA